MPNSAYVSTPTTFFFNRSGVPQRVQANKFRCLTAAFLAAGSIWPLAAAASGEHTHHVAPSGLPHNIPDLCAGATISSVASGAWSDPATWAPARVPQSGDRVRVSAGTTISYNLVSNDDLRCVGVYGRLNFRTDVSTRLTVGTLMVMPAGELWIGDEWTPVASHVSAEIVIANLALDTSSDPEQYGTGVIGFGKITIHGSPKYPTFSRLTAEARAGDATLHLSESASGWLPGDRLVVPDSRQLLWTQIYARYTPQYEVPIVAGTSGTSVSLTAGLSFSHPGGRNLDGALEFLPHVANLTRNVVIRSFDPGGTRGHVIFVGRSSVDVRYAQFSQLGRTTIAPLDSTTLDAAGSVTHLGTNQIGRYPIHLHHVMGPIPSPASGYQFTLIGNAVSDTPKWGIAVHNTHFGLLRDNVVYNSDGAAYMAEDGSESQNLFDHNFAVRGKGTGGRDGLGREGVGFYFRGPNNIVRNNVAANFLSDGPDAAYGFKYFFEYLGAINVPNFPGADTTVAGQYTVKNGNTMPLLEFRDNEVYGATESGLSYWWVGANIALIPGAQPSFVQNLRVWHVYNKGIFHYPAARVVIDGLVVRGVPSAEGVAGIDMADYVAHNISIRNANIQGMSVGIFFSTDTDGGWQLLSNSYLRNRINVQLTTLWTNSAYAETIKPRRVIIHNTRFAAAPASAAGPQEHISMGYAAKPTRNLIIPDQIFVYDYNGVSGDDFQAFYAEQAPSFVVPETVLVAGTSAPSLIGAPFGGKTNAENWTLYRIAIGGAVASCATTRVEVARGFACPTSELYSEPSVGAPPLSWTPPAGAAVIPVAPPVIPTSSVTPAAGGCFTPDPFVAMGGGACVNGGWLPPGIAPITQPPTVPLTPATPSVPATPAATASSAQTGQILCSTPDPFTALGGGTCRAGGWLPPGMAGADPSTVAAPAAAPPTAASTSPSQPSSAPSNQATAQASGCVSADPFTILGGGTCINGGWLPPGMGSPTTAAQPVVQTSPATSKLPTNCSTPDPFAAIGGGLCVNGGWIPRKHSR